ncbi:Cell division protein FtsK [Thermodesulfovibrio sp. N1]|uniref:FtsK/SpoIIIE family DNA translocase n=1 Tax=unclassified Thermodesulfovibrio TaxID=2645936 RepID=UPI0008587E3E|nr:MULTISPECIES: DNA translocase FtsK [unclassified Thermodesulfovibrio]MDI1471689.1 DNA translocase FtsK 4TM domain-containing protein [Thermodesulfovibrio sp. 1176]ODA44283.1 Cell division protein FtsK [Thermodesulfovibrio sp. N1]
MEKKIADRKIKKVAYYRKPKSIKKNSKSFSASDVFKSILLIAFAVYLAVSLLSYYYLDPSFLTYTKAKPLNYGGIVGSYLSDLILSIFGVGGFLLPPLILFLGIKRFIGNPMEIIKLPWVLIILFSSSVMLEPLREKVELYIKIPEGLSFIAFYESEKFISLTGTYILWASVFIASIILIKPEIIKRRKEETPLESETSSEIKVVKVSKPGPPLKEPPKILKSKDIDEKQKIEAEQKGFLVPPLSLLKIEKTEETISKDEIIASARSIEARFSEFGIHGSIKEVHPGPVVTMYEFEPASGIKLSKIITLSDELALSLKAQSIRIYPIPGRSAIGIEVPNKKRQIVRLGEIISSEKFQNSSSYLTLALGKDIYGNPVVTDLAKMPHLLVAGATGSGKSVCLNTMILSLLYKATPHDVRLLLIDPKLLELSTYENIPHLMYPVITEPKEASEALKKVIVEMERRYKLFASRGFRNIDSFNQSVPIEEKIPYIVVFIDEFADLMFTAPTEVEQSITRIAQMARASGIHLVVATQRPSVDVITGIIKANFPARIAFQVSSRIDSRTILDSQGAEKLLGMGDMLFMISGVKIIRVHGAYVSEEEVKSVTEYLRSQGSPDYSLFESIEIPENKKDNGKTQETERDELYEQVIEYATQTGEISISLIQRRFKIGYNRAARIMDLLEQDGLVGPPQGAGKPRKFLGR